MSSQAIQLSPPGEDRTTLCCLRCGEVIPAVAFTEQPVVQQVRCPGCFHRSLVTATRGSVEPFRASRAGRTPSLPPPAPPSSVSPAPVEQLSHRTVGPPPLPWRRKKTPLAALRLVPSARPTLPEWMEPVAAPTLEELAAGGDPFARAYLVSAARQDQPQDDDHLTLDRVPRWATVPPLERVARSPDRVEAPRFIDWLRGRLAN